MDPIKSYEAYHQQIMDEIERVNKEKKHKNMLLYAILLVIIAVISYSLGYLR